MSRTKRDILETESMLTRLTNLLVEHAKPENKIIGPRVDAESLRRISMTLHRWHEMECGNSNDYKSVALVRGIKHDKVTFEYCDNGKPYLETHYHDQNTPRYFLVPDREAGAHKRLAKILARYPGLTAYVQTDPRGCALYILRPGDVPEGADISSCYSRGFAVHR